MMAIGTNHSTTKSMTNENRNRIPIKNLILTEISNSNIEPSINGIVKCENT